MKSLFKKVLVFSLLTLAAFGFTGCNNNVESHEHIFSEWSEGKRDCPVCGYEQTCEHTWDEWTEGSRICSVCKHEQVCDHIFGVWTIIIHPTEENEGSKERSCNVCGMTEDEAVAKLDHVHKLGTHHAAVPGTCKTQGIVEYYDCVKALCQVKLDKDGKPLASVDGEFDPTNHEETAVWIKTAATHQEVYGCCDTVKSADSEHTWDEGKVTTMPTCVTKGVRTYTCPVCKITRTEEIPELYNSPVDAETGLAATANSAYVYFGAFPRTVLPSDTEITVDENDFVKIGTSTFYYKGSDGEYYAKVLENACGTGTQYAYSNGEPVKRKDADSYRYFKVEPIKWKVLTTAYDIDGEAGSATGALLLAEDILTANVPYYESTSSRTIDGKTVCPNNYQHSQIRAYLNGLTYQGQSGDETKWNGKGFLQTAFTETALEKIATVEVDNRKETTGYDESSYATDYACENTKDKIFLLSESEVINSDYGFDTYDCYDMENARILFATDYAKANYAQVSPKENCDCSWFLRSPGFTASDQACNVNYDGFAGQRSYVNRVVLGVLPALCVSLK